GLAQRDKRVVLLSDLADGSPPDAPPLGGEGEIALWAPLPELTADGQDCAVTRADRSGNKVWARVVCTSSAAPVPAPSARPAAGAGAPGPSAGRSVEVRAGDKVVASAALGPSVTREDVAIDLPAGAPEMLRAVL